MIQDQILQDTTKYARFTRRVQALMYDSMILVVIMALTLFLATASEGIGASRFIGFAGAAVILLYEPILVSMRGATIGHSMRNLCVVDDLTHGNIGFLKAVARFAIKIPLGILSFLTMATTQRHQAVHDLLTGSTVRIRDERKADHFHYYVARTELADQATPSRLRRAITILGYLLLFGVSGFPAIGAAAQQLLTAGCIRDESSCTTTEQLTIQALGLVFLAICAVIVVAGWRGMLPGCRRSTSDASLPGQQS